MDEQAGRWTPTNHIVLGIAGAAAFVSTALGFAVVADEHLGWHQGFVAGAGVILGLGAFLVALVLMRQKSKSRSASRPVAIAAALALVGAGLTVWQVTVTGDPPPPTEQSLAPD